MPRIEAYAHQVGGHCQIVKPAQSSKIFKPLNAAEHDFYESLASSVSDFSFGPTSVAIYPTEDSENPYYLTYQDLLGKKRQASLEVLDSLPIFCKTFRKDATDDLTRLVSEECLDGVQLRDYTPASPFITITTSTASSGHGGAESQDTDAEGEEKYGNFNDFLQSNAAFDVARKYPLNVLKAFYLPRYHGSTEVHLRSTVPARGRTSGCGSRPGVTPPRTESDDVSLVGVVSEDCSSSASVLSSRMSPATQDAGGKAAGAPKSRGERKVESSECTGSGPVELQVLEYIVLEDLVNGYRRPCVMDLKMGRRQKKLGASGAKRQRQIEKSTRTTSYALGFRLCGCKVYDKKNDVLYCRDKYWGRELKVHQVRDSIKQFFCDGYQLDWRLTESLILRLKILYECIKNLPGFRFWSSSLLWVFDGGVDSHQARLRSLDVKIIDFTNTVLLPEDNATPDMEYLYGLQNLIDYLESILADHRGD